MLAVVLTGVLMILFSRAPTMELAFPLLMLVSASTMLFFSTASATIQSIAPEAFRGRVASIYALTFGALPAGSLLDDVYEPAEYPPSTSMTAPVIQDASADRRKLTSPATSLGSPARPSG